MTDKRHEDRGTLMKWKPHKRSPLIFNKGTNHSIFSATCSPDKAKIARLLYMAPLMRIGVSFNLCRMPTLFMREYYIKAQSKARSGSSAKFIETTKHRVSTGLTSISIINRERERELRLAIFCQLVMNLVSQNSTGGKGGREVATNLPRR